jgi:hypothetical protein
MPEAYGVRGGAALADRGLTRPGNDKIVAPGQLQN